MKNDGRKNVEEIVFSYTYPRLDAEVTTLEQCTPVYGHVYSHYLTYL